MMNRRKGKCVMNMWNDCDCYCMREEEEDVEEKEKQMI